MNIFEQPMVKEQLEAQTKGQQEFHENLTEKNEENHIQEINELHVESQKIHKQLMENSTDFDNPKVANMAYLGDVEGLEDIEKQRDQNFKDMQTAQEKIIKAMDKKENRDTIINIIKDNPSPLN